jgi:hypothetical protein
METTEMTAVPDSATIDIVPEVTPVKAYDQKKYNKNFCVRHCEKIHKKTDCDVCGGSYTYFNKSKHHKSQRHLKMMARLAVKGSSA